MDIEQPLTIAELAASFGVSHRSLRFYEERGLLRPQRKGTVRYYGRPDRLRLQLVLKGKKLGFSLQEISRLILSHETPRADEPVPDAMAHLSRAQIAGKLVTLEAERRRVDDAIAELRAALEKAPTQIELEPA